MYVYLINKPLQVAGISEENTREWKIVLKISQFALKLTVHFSDHILASGILSLNNSRRIDIHQWYDNGKYSCVVYVGYVQHATAKGLGHAWLSGGMKFRELPIFCVSRK